ncbi:MAG: DNA translocase FtsK 4TM domain-containing protein, partial [Pseudohongiellaceae bacterium]
MSKASTKTTESEYHAGSLRSLFLKEALLIVLLAIGAYLFLALQSYSPLDPGWSRTGDVNNIANDAGQTGAWIADVLFLLFGYLAYLFPLMMVYRALVIFRDRHQTGSFSWELFALRCLGFILTMIGATALAAMHFLAPLPESAGGLIGAGIVAVSLPAFDLIGSTLVFLSVLFIGITLATGLSWLSLVDNTGRLCLKFMGNMRDWLQHRKVVSREKQETRRAIEKRKQALDHFIEKDKKRKPIRIAPVREAPREPSKRVQKEKQGKLFEAASVGELPPISLLDEWVENLNAGYSTEALEA